MRLKLAFAFIALLPVCCVASPSSAQNPPNIIEIFQQFLASRFAALGCGAIDSATELNFMSNLMTVTIRAEVAFKEANPNLTKSELDAQIKQIPPRIKHAIDSEISTNTCSSPRIQQLLTPYKVQSRMSL